MIRNMKNYVKGNAFLLPVANKSLKTAGLIRIYLVQRVKNALNLFSKSKRIAPIDYCKVQNYVLSKNTPESYAEIYPEHEIVQAKPHCIEEKVHWKFELVSHRTSPPVFAAKLRNGRLLGNPGVVITEDNIVLEEVSRILGGHITETDVFRKVILPRPTVFAETIGVISASAGEGFFHWMFEVLPRIHIINQSPWVTSKIVVNSVNSKFQEETLSILGLLDNVIVLKANEQIQANELIVPSLPRNMPQWVCDFLRKSFLPDPNGFDGKRKRLYISRAKANNGRSVLNESEVMDLLTPLGFEKILSENLSFQKQVSYFSQAEVIIAPHGAGLSNLVFCDEKTRVLEFFSPNYVNACFYALANMVGLEYYYLIGEGKRPPDYCDPEIVGANIIVDIASLRKLLNMMGLLPEN